MSKRLRTFPLMILLCCDFVLGQTIVYDDGQEHLLTEDTDRVIVTNQSKLDLQAMVQDVNVDSATLAQNGGVIGGVPQEDTRLYLRNGSNVSLNAGLVYAVDMDASTLSLNGGKIRAWDCGTMSIRNGSHLSLNLGEISSVGPGCPSLVSTDSNVQITGVEMPRIELGGASTVVVRYGRTSTGPWPGSRAPRSRFSSRSRTKPNPTAPAGPPLPWPPDRTASTRSTPSRLSSSASRTSSPTPPARRCANPVARYNPLFLYGGVGLGKTHLLHAIGHEIHRRQPRRQRLYLACEQFVND